MDRHTLLVAPGVSAGFCWMNARKGILMLKAAWRLASTTGSDVRPVFFPQPFRVGIGNRPERADLSVSFWQGTDSFLKGLILAQNERWRRGLGMQVERAWFSDQVSGVRVSKATATNPMVGHSRGKLRVIPSDVRAGHPVRTKVSAPWDGPSWY